MLLFFRCQRGHRLIEDVEAGVVFLHRLLADGHYDRHLKRLAQRTDAASIAVKTRLLEEGHKIYPDAVNGYYIYLLLPAGVDDIELAREGAKESIFIAPGSLFCIDKNAPLSKEIRVNVSRAESASFYDFLARYLL